MPECHDRVRFGHIHRICLFRYSVAVYGGPCRSRGVHSSPFTAAAALSFVSILAAVVFYFNRFAAAYGGPCGSRGVHSNPFLLAQRLRQRAVNPLSGQPFNCDQLGLAKAG